MWSAEDQELSDLLAIPLASKSSNSFLAVCKRSGSKRRGLAVTGLVERLHRQLKAAIMCHADLQWTEALPLVLLGLRSAWKEDIQASPAELVYGEPLRLPGQFISPSDDYSSADLRDLSTRLRSLMARLSPRPTSWHRKGPFFVPRDLSQSSHVFIRQGHVRKPLEPPYAGPYEVLERQPKHFKIKVRDKSICVTIDRLKPAYTSKEIDTQGAPTPSPTIPHKQTRSGRKVHFPDYYRS